MIYVGASVVAQSGQFPVQVDNATPFVAGRSFIGFAAPPLSASTVALGVRSTPANPETYFIRANGSNAGFTYQGSLDVTGAAYTGTADLLVGIYDAASAGNAVSANFAIPGVAFDNGRFSVRIPADASTFDPGADRWLEIAVKRAGEAGYTTLSPRQRITSVPTALAAARVNWNGVFNAPASFPPWNQVSNGISYSAGRVGIGTSAPSNTLHVEGTARFSGPTNGGRIVTTDFPAGDGTQLLGTIFGNNAGPQFRFVTSSSAANFIDLGQNANGDFVVEGNDNPRLVVANAGNVGIGNPSPATLLHIGSYSTGPNALRIAAVGAKTASLQFRFFSDNYGWDIDSVDDNVVNPTGLYIRSAFNSATFTNRVFINSESGNVGIGTTNAPHRLTVSGNVAANNVVVPSSIRFKDHVAPLHDALDALLKLDGVRFDWKPEFAATRSGRVHDMGFVAEDVEKIFPELVFRDADGNVTGMDYSRLTAVAVAAIKVQQARFEADKAAKQAEIDALKARLAAIEASLLKMSKEHK